MVALALNRPGLFALRRAVVLLTRAVVPPRRCNRLLRGAVLRARRAAGVTLLRRRLELGLIARVRVRVRFADVLVLVLRWAEVVLARFCIIFRGLVQLTAQNLQLPLLFSNRV